MSNYILAKFHCPDCGTKIGITAFDRHGISVYRYKEEEAPKRPRKLRPRSLSKKLHEAVHGEAPSNGAAKAKFDRNKYQRELMRKRRSEGITGKEPG